MFVDISRLEYLCTVVVDSNVFTKAIGGGGGGGGGGLRWVDNFGYPPRSKAIGVYYFSKKKSQFFTVIYVIK